MAYSTTKAAGLHLMKCLAATQGPKIRVNAILPGQLLTDWVCDMISYRNLCFLPQFGNMVKG
jgi:NAD(P)-dependent dehydrogenase (short-subunit alcohol dehydrogenase family)